MTDEIFNYLYEAMYSSVWLAAAASLGWGVLSILLSPCHLSSIPLIIGYLTSQGSLSFKRTFNLSLVFAIGILISIAIIGFITASLGRMMGDIGSTGNYLVAGIFFIAGLYLLEILKFDWKFFSLKKTKTTGLLSALMLGFLFGIALGPCTFAYMAPVLGIVFQTAQTDYFTSILLLGAFGIGHCSVIVAAGVSITRVQNYLNKSEDSKVFLWTKRICGILVILGGVYLIMNTY